jgi:hypothetical protein
MGVNELVCGSSKLKEKVDGDRSALILLTLNAILYPEHCLD